MTQYLGDYAEDYADLNFKWHSTDLLGDSVNFDTNGTISVYKSNNTTQTTAGITDTRGFDSLTGIHNVKIDLSADAFYETGEDYMVVLSGSVIHTDDGSTDGIDSSVNAVLAHFSIENRFDEVDVTKWLGTACAAPTTAGVPEVDVTHISGDSTAADNLEAACDNYTATRGLSGTALPAAAADAAGGLVISDAGGLDIDAFDARCSETRLSELDPANLPADVDSINTASGQILADTNELQQDWTDTGRLDTLLDAVLADTADMQPKLGAPSADLAADIAAVQSDTDDIQTRLPAALVGGRMDSDVGNIQSDVVDADAIAADAIDASELATGAVTEIVNSIALYDILADAIYSNGSLDVSACLVKNGQVQTSVSNARASLYQLDGTLIDALTTVSSADANGEFKFPTLSRTLAQNTMFYVVVTIEDATTGGTDRSANVKVKRFS